jgi:hypothetical protein
MPVMPLDARPRRKTSATAQPALEEIVEAADDDGLFAVALIVAAYLGCP